MIAPHRSTGKLKTQDGRHLRRSQRRWLVERFFAWLQWKRRLLIRWEYYATNVLGVCNSHPFPCCSSNVEIGSRRRFPAMCAGWHETTPRSYESPLRGNAPLESRAVAWPAPRSNSDAAVRLAWSYPRSIVRCT